MYIRLINKIKSIGLKNVLRLITKKIGEKIDKLVISILRKILPVKDNLFVFESEGDFTDNIKAFYDYILKNEINVNIEIVWFVHSPNKYKVNENVKFISRYRFLNLRADYYIAVAHIFLFSHPYWLTKWRKEQVVIHTTHSASQLKKDTGSPIKISDYVLVCSEDVREKRKDAFLIPEENLLIIGQPRIDLLYEHRNYIKELIPNYNGEKIILSMETFKQTKNWKDSEKINLYAINVINNIEEIEKLDDFLKRNGYILIVKVHHLQDISVLKITKLKNIYYFNDDDLQVIGIQTNQVLENADVLLTDYSSVFFEFLLLNRPIGFLLGDMKSYSRGFNMDDPLNFMPGTKIYDVNQLIDFIKNIEMESKKYERKREEICKLTFKYRDNNNSERLWKWISNNCLKKE